MVERLRRLDWVFDRAPIYFITACAASRRKILANSPVHECLEQFAANGSSRGVWLGAYVLMPDHLHAFVAFTEGGSNEGGGYGSPPQLSGFVKSLKNTVSKVLRGEGIEAPHWQKGFFDHVLRSAESYDGKWEYVRQNPVRAGLVVRVEDWPYQGQPFDLEYRRDRV